MLVFCSKITPRLEYVFRFVFERALGLTVDFTTTLDVFIAHTGPKMSYGKTPLGNEFFIYASSFLFEQGVQPVNITPVPWNEKICFFKAESPSFLPFDIFSSVFLCISRYEEYLPHLNDEFGRFLASQSLVVQHNQHETPLVDYWIKELYQKLNEYYPELTIDLKPKKETRVLIDVVRPYKYLYNSFIVGVIQWVKSILQLNLWEVVEHLMVLFGLRKDPWDTFDVFKHYFKGSPLRIQFFFLYSSVSYHDRAISYLDPRFQSKIKEVADYFKVSLLASFSAQSNGKKLRDEREKLNQLIHRDVDSVRYAWGVSTVGETYQPLVAQEVRNDFSLAYPDLIGYRASTTIPYLFYDLANEMTTELTVYPVVANEDSLRKLTPIDAIKKLRQLYSKIPMSTGVHCFALTNKIIEKSVSNAAYRSAFISYLQGHEERI